MIIKANVEMGLSSLLVSKQRSVLALLGIVIGIGAVIAMVSIGVIIKEETLKQFAELGTDYIIISKSWGGYGRSGKTKREEIVEITFDQGMELGRSVPSIKESTPIGTSYVNYIYRGQRLNAGLVATTENFLGLNRMSMEEGRYITDFDLNMPYCVIGSEVAKTLKDKGAYNLVGEQVKMQDRLFTVIGVLKPARRSSMMPFDPNKSIYIPYSTYSRVFEEPAVSDVLARMREGFEPQAVSQAITDYFKLRDPRLEIEVTMAHELIAQRQNQAQMYTLLLTAIGSISLIVGGVGVMNVMLVSVTERKKEIGIRRALGALRGDIQLQFLIESLVLCIVGGLLGVVLGIGASYLIAWLKHMEFLISSMAIILGVGVSTLIGIFFGYYPARQASRLDPIVALRAD